MVELVDSPASGAGVRKDVRVRLPPRAPEKKHLLSTDKRCFFSTKCSACAERDVPFGRDVCFASDVRFAREDAEHITSLCDQREQNITVR